MSKQEDEKIYHECIYHIKEDKYKTQNWKPVITERRTHAKGEHDPKTRKT